MSTSISTLDQSSPAGAAPLDEMLRSYDRAIDGRYDPDEALRYRIVQGERICGWSCDPSSPYYKEDHHMCPAECRGNFWMHRPGRKKKFLRIDDVCGGLASAPALPPPVGKAS